MAFDFITPGYPTQNDGNAYIEYPVSFAAIIKSGFIWANSVNDDQYAFLVTCTSSPNLIGAVIHFVWRRDRTTTPAKLVLEFYKDTNNTVLQARTALTDMDETTGAYLARGFSFGGSTTPPDLYCSGVLDNSTSVSNAGVLNATGSYLMFGGVSVPTNRELKGVLGQPAFWSEELTAAEHLALAKGVSPLLIRPHALLFYSEFNSAAPPDRLTGTIPTVIGTAPGPVEDRALSLGPHGGLQNVGGFSARRRAIINLLTGDQTGGSHWDEVKALVPNSAVTRFSDTEVRIDLGAFDTAGYDNTSDEIITLSNVTTDMWKK
jgi:hypothetical protein